MPVFVPGILLSIADLEAHLHRDISAKDAQSAQSAVDYAVALVGDVLGFDVTGTEYTVADSDVLIVRSVAVRIGSLMRRPPLLRSGVQGWKPGG